MYVITDRADGLRKFFIGLEPDPQAPLSDKLCWGVRPVLVPIDHDGNELKEMAKQERSPLLPIKTYGHLATIVFTPYQIRAALELAQAWKPIATGPKLDPQLFTAVALYRASSIKPRRATFVLGDALPIEAPRPTQPKHSSSRAEPKPSSLRPAYPEQTTVLEYVGKMMQHNRQSA